MWSAMRTNRQRAFTLVEMLVAIGILALIASLGWRSLDSMLRSRVALTDSMQQTRALQRTFAQLQDDCANIASTEAIGQFARMRIESGRLGLIRNVLEDGLPSRLQAVVYQVDGAILRRQESYASRDLQMLARFLQQPNVGAARNTALLDEVPAIVIRTWNGNWRADVPVDASVTGIEMTLMLPSGDGQISRLFLLGQA
jgi:general secretion pathway protein J